MAIYYNHIELDINDENVYDILNEKLGSDCFGLSNDCWWAITFYWVNEEDNWALGWLSKSEIELVNKWLEKENIPRDKQFLISRSW